jgi:hypothetical protein
MKFAVIGDLGPKTANFRNTGIWEIFGKYLG